MVYGLMEYCIRKSFNYERDSMRDFSWGCVCFGGRY